MRKIKGKKRRGGMGISFEIDSDEGIVYAMAEGTIGLEDLLTAREKLLADPNFSPDLPTLIEFRMSNIGMFDKETEALISSLPTQPKRKLAIVGVGANREWALRYKELVKDKVHVEVFTDMWSAKKWVTSD